MPAYPGTPITAYICFGALTTPKTSPIFCTRFPKSSWRNLDIRTCLLAPGETGPISTGRFEMLREGLQMCEARIAIERALTDEALKKKLGAQLAERCGKLMTERTRDVKVTLWNRHPSMEEWGGTAAYYKNIAIPLSIGAQMIARGDVQVTGVLPPETAIDPEIFFREMAQPRIEIHERVEEL